MQRRRFLQTAPVLGVSAFAGCSARDGSGLNTDRDTGSEEPPEAIDLPWTELPGPPGGPVTYVSLSRADPDWLYSTTRTAGLFVSSDGGRSWMQGFSGQHHRPRVWASPHDPKTAYTQIERTDDGGRTWYGDHVASNTPSKDRHGPIGGPDNRIYFMGWAPEDPGTIYAATRKGFYRTFDDGRSWERREIPDVELPPPFRGWDVAVHPERAGLVVAALRNVVATSDDRGETWTVTDLGVEHGLPDDRFVRGVTFAGPETEGVYLAMEGRAVFRLRNDGLAELTADLPDLVFPKQFTLSPSSSGERLYFVAGRSSRMYPQEEWWDDRRLYVYDRDTGAVDPVSVPVKPSSVATHPTDARTLYVGGNSWVHESRDAGETWEALSAGFVDHYLATVAVNPSHPETVVPGSLCSTGITVSHDRGMTYEWKRSGLPPWHQGEFGEHYVMQIAAGGERIYATTAAGLLVSGDNGRSWRLMENRFSGRGEFGGTYTHLHGLAVHPQDPDVVYVGTGMGGAAAERDAFEGRSSLWKSEDGGASWREITDGYPSDRDTVVQDVHVSRFDPEVVYVGTNAEDYIHTDPARGYGVYKSTDGGGRWAPLSTPFENVHAITQRADDADTLFASSPRGVYRTDDAGTSWERVLRHETQALLAHPGEPGVLFAAVQQYDRYWDVLVSTDGGETWVSGDLTIQVGLETERREYDAAERHSHYWGSSGDVKWFAFDEVNSLLYAATNGTGLWRADASAVGGDGGGT